MRSLYEASLGPRLHSLSKYACLAPFLKYGDLLAKNCLFPTLSYSAPPLPVFPLEFRSEVNREKTKVMEAILQ